MVVPSQLCSIRSACLQQSCALRACRLPSSRAQTSLKHGMFSESELHRPWLGADVLVESQGWVHSNLDSYSAQHGSAASMQTRLVHLGWTRPD